jgi:hypothetical protein
VDGWAIGTHRHRCALALRQAAVAATTAAGAIPPWRRPPMLPVLVSWDRPFHFQWGFSRGSGDGMTEPLSLARFQISSVIPTRDVGGGNRSAAASLPIGGLDCLELATGCVWHLAQHVFDRMSTPRGTLLAVLLSSRNHHPHSWSTRSRSRCFVSSLMSMA